jgi:hypothetical protein
VTIEGFAMNDFQAMATGNIDTLTGETTNGGCRFNPVIFTIRPQ